MANRKIMLPQYGTVMKRGVLYYRTRIKDANGKLVAIYAKHLKNYTTKKRLRWNRLRMPLFIGKRPQLQSIVKSGC